MRGVRVRSYTVPSLSHSTHWRPLTPGAILLLHCVLQRRTDRAGSGGDPRRPLSLLRDLSASASVAYGPAPDVKMMTSASWMAAAAQRRREGGAELEDRHRLNKGEAIGHARWAHACCGVGRPRRFFNPFRPRTRLPDNAQASGACQMRGAARVRPRFIVAAGQGSGCPASPRHRGCA